MLYKKAFIQKVTWKKLTFIQMLYKEFDTLYVDSISFFLIYNKRKLRRK